MLVAQYSETDSRYAFVLVNCLAEVGKMKIVYLLPLSLPSTRHVSDIINLNRHWWRSTGTGGAVNQDWWRSV
jgi:hypothetical protein